ncbi:MAG TPA: hypothetical protein PLX43_08090 [Nitrobacter sp.]|nr:hypothetical protein [Nitrobacter sp.]
MRGIGPRDLRLVLQPGRGGAVADGADTVWRIGFKRASPWRFSGPTWILSGRTCRIVL